MDVSIPQTMKAAAIDRFGGPDVIHLHDLPVPQPKPDEVLIRLDAAGIGVWDPYVREGELASGVPTFPQIIGNDGAGTVVAVGKEVTLFQPGDRVYAYTMEGGFYAEYNAVKEDAVAPIPPGVATDEAGALGADGITALRGLEDQLHLRPGETLLIYGASGGIGHIAVQLAKRLGVRVMAVASGEDGVELARRLGADAAVDGRAEDATAAARAFAPGGIDAALLLAGGAGATAALGALKKNGRVAHPNGVEPEPEIPEGLDTLPYDGIPDRDAFNRLNRLIDDRPFHVEIARTYDLDEAADAHREIEGHHLGKRAFRLRHQ
jgi:NADPH:quinone reductase-like Zn-dependent oxidoreductase